MSRTSDDGTDTIYSWRERLSAIPIGCGLVGLIGLDDLVFGDTSIGVLVGSVIAFAVLACLMVAVFGRVSNDA